MDTLGTRGGRGDAPHTCPCGHSAATALWNGIGAWHAGHGSHSMGTLLAGPPASPSRPASARASRATSSEPGRQARATILMANGLSASVARVSVLYGHGRTHQTGGELWAHRLTLAEPRVCGVRSLSGREIGCAIRRRSIGRRRLADRAPVQRCAAGGPCVSELADMVYGRTAHMEATMSFLRRISNVSEPRRCAPKV